MPRFTIIIPAYNAAATLPLAARSVLSQTFTDLELIIVDDGSTDATPALCDEIGRADSRVRVMHGTNIGQGLSRNRALDVAQGEYVGFLDADDFFATDALEWVDNLLRRENPDAVRFMLRMFRGAEPELGPSGWDPDDYTVMRGRDAVMPLIEAVTPTGIRNLPESAASACTGIYRRALIEEHSVRFLSEREVLSEDCIFNIDFLTHAAVTVYTPAAFYHYRQTPGSWSHRINHSRLEQAADFARYYTERLQALGIGDAGFRAGAFLIGEMRSYAKSVFAARLPHSRKRRLYFDMLDVPAVKDLLPQFPVRRLPVQQRLALSLLIHRQYLLSRVLYGLRNLRP